MLIFLTNVSCRKEVEAPDSPEAPVKPGSRTEEQLLKDSVYYYYKLYSLWEQSIPKYSTISQFTDTLSSPIDVLHTLMLKTPAYAAYSSSTGTYDRFSFLTELSYSSSLSSKLKMDNNDGFGVSFAIGAISDTVAYPFVNFVEGGSPASIQGLVRSDMIISLNDVDMKIKVSCKSGGCSAAEPAKFSAILSQLNSSLNASTMSVKIQKDDKSIRSYSLSSRTYEIDPLVLDTVFKFSNMNVGYFVYSSFEEIESNNSNQKKVDALFDKFAANEIKSLVVDLRYNGGGYVDAATYLANKIINSNGNGKLMLTYKLNDYLERSKSVVGSTFSDVYFKKNNNLELGTVCFIVSENTASASEMLINVLKPYMNVKLIAEGTNTYGKPVGFFPQEIMDKIELWVTSFKLINANKESDYWTGLVADKTNVSDYIFLNFGNKDESMLFEALAMTGAVNLQARSNRLSKLKNDSFKKIQSVTDVAFKGALKTKK